MKQFMLRTVLIFLVACLGVATVHAQGRLIRKVQDRVEDKILDEVFKDEKGRDVGTSDPNSGSSRTSTSNRRGGGLTQTPPDVNQSIKDAEVAYAKSSYVEAKSAVRQALWGVELEIGQNILKSLPDEVYGLQKLPEEDRVTSTGIGFVGLVIERVYQGKDDMELRVTVGSDAGLIGLTGMYWAGGMYQTSTEETNMKQIRFQDHRATITYDEYTGYTLGVPFGQSSVFVIDGVNFESEDEFMAAADNFSIDSIKKQLGEQ